MRRLAASAIGKLAGLVADPQSAVTALQTLLQDHFPQVRQYTAKALSAFGSAAQCSLSDLRDMATSPAEPQYNNNCAKLAIRLIEEARRIAESQAVQCCQRCGVKLEADEFVRSQKAF